MLQTSFFALTGYRRLPEPMPEEAEAAKAVAEAIEPLSDKDCEPSGLPLPFQPLVRRERLWPRLRQSLQQRWTAGVDLPRLVAHLSRGELPRRLPARRHSGLTAQVFVLWDAADRLTPYAEDYRRLIAELHHLHGAAGLRLWQVHDGPDEVWGEWAPERVAWPERWPGSPWRKDNTERPGDAADLPDIPSGSRVLLLSDLGGLARHAAPARRWMRALQRWRADGVATTAWVPQGPGWVAPALAAHADEVHCLTPNPSRVRAAGRPGASSLETHIERHQQRQNDLCDELLVRASICIHLEPALLRSLRHTLPALAAEPGLEALAWSRQPVVRSSRVSRALSAEHAPEYRRRFGELGEQAQRVVLGRLLAAHRCHGRSTETTEVLIWQAHARKAAADAEAATVESARKWTLAWSERVKQDASRGAVSDAARGYATDLLARTGSDAAFMADQSRWISQVWALSDRITVPQGLSAEHVHAALRQTRNRNSIDIVNWTLEMQDRAVRLASTSPVKQDRSFSFLSDSCWIEGSCLGQRVVLREPVLSPVALVRSGDPGQRLVFSAQGQELTFTELVRPAWASDWGLDRYGLFATLEVAGVSQRMRWIPPGRFLMGSPGDEPGRYTLDGPQHEVTLTRGFWLADTCCTQALWLAVMGGENPSQFTGDPSLPVDSVSWDDALSFLTRLERKLPVVVETALPTEAQWEYACRAGTATRYCFGNDISPEQANFGSNVGRTIVVKSLPANPWGLYEMHGNVDEWCADARRIYGVEPVSDPNGGQEDGNRVLRGGAWFSEPRRARSGYRARSFHNSRVDTRGFRFALKCIEAGAEGGMDFAWAEVSKPTKSRRKAKRK